MPDPSELERQVRSAKESRTIEFKASMSWAAPETQAKVVKTALAMANLRDGGIMVFGAQDVADSPTVELVGMSQTDYRSFNQTDVSQTVNTHAVPNIDLSVEHLVIDEKSFVVIVFRQFVDYPVLCSRDLVVEGRARLIKGRVYCRSRRAPESTEVQTPEDLREIITLATDKGIERYFQQREIERRATGPTAAQRFAQEAADFS